MVEATPFYDIHNDDDWNTIFPNGYSTGFVRLGKGAKFYEPSIYHQMHCLNILRQSIVHHDWSNATNQERVLWHVHHCLNMIRQAILCNADSTLEPSFFYRLNKGKNESAASGLDVLHTCRDWTQIRAYAESNFHDTKTLGAGRD